MINVTQPYLPSLEEFYPYLEKIWDNKWLTNNGKFHQQLESELSVFFDVPYISLFNNGTNALITALQSLDISGEVITTPYTFLATTNSLIWNNLTPVFVDIDPVTMNIDPNEIEKAITGKTSAILAVHVYGNPCNVEAIENIASKYKLKVIYDAAHAFGVNYKKESILKWGDLSVLSFHATKVFNTFEGGAIVSQNKEMKDKIDSLKNFGILPQSQVSIAGSNGKMNEIQAAMGLIQLKHFQEIMRKRQIINDSYCSSLNSLKGIETITLGASTAWNYSYFPILVDKKKYGINRNDLHNILNSNGYNSRKYFYPLVSNLEAFQKFNKRTYPIAKRKAESVLCLPIYPELVEKDYARIIEIIIENSK